MSEIDLDQYLGTPDEHFNANAQNWYFEFTGTKRPDCNMSFDVFISAVHELYIFFLGNRNKPMACLNQVKVVAEQRHLSAKDALVLVNHLLGVLSHHDELSTFMRPFMQLVDYRHQLSPYTEDPDVKNHTWEFSFEQVKADLHALETAQEKKVYLVNLIIDFKQKARQMDELTLQYYLETGFLQNCVDEALRIKLHGKLEKQQSQQPLTVENDIEVDEKIKVAKKYLHFFSGYNYSRQKIMTDTNFQKLISAVSEYLKNEQSPVSTQPIPQTGLSNEFIRYTFYLIHKELFGTRNIRNSMIDLIHNLFSQFKGTDQATTKTKFSVKPKLYDTDSTYRAG